MGAWGTGILQNDTTADVWTEFRELYNFGSTCVEIRIKLEEKYEINDSSEFYADFWTGIAHGQWMYGEQETYVLDKVKNILHKGYGLQLWNENTKELKNRTKTIQKFYEKIKIPKAKPSKRKVIARNPSYFKKGDILSIELDDNYFVSALVFEEQDDDTHGANWIVFLDLILSEPINVSQVTDAKIMYLDLGGQSEYHRGYFWAQFEAKNMKRKIKKTQVIGKVDFNECLSLSNSVPYGDWNKLKNLYDEQKIFLESNTTCQPKKVIFKEFISGDVEPLTSELEEHAQAIWEEQLDKINAT